LLEGDDNIRTADGNFKSEAVWHLEDKNLLKKEQMDLIARVAGPLRSVQEYPLNQVVPNATSGYCLCQHRFGRWKRYFVELRGTQLVFKTLKKGGETSKVKTVMNVRFVSFGKLTISEKEAITAANLSTDCTERFRVFNDERTRVIIPSSNGDFDQWSSALHSLLESHLDPSELEERRRMAKDVEPVYERHEEYLQKKAHLILGALSHVGFLENEKKNCVRQGVIKMKNDSDDWRKTFVLLKAFSATYHESGKSYKKGFINLKLARIETSAKSDRRFKVFTPMATYSFKARHAVDAKDWISALTAAAQGKNRYDGSQEALDELDSVVVAPFTKPFLSYKGKKYKLVKDAVVIGRSSACTIVVGDDKKVSREHCKIECRGPSKWVLADMGSNSGTLLNGAKCTQHLLKPGDVIEIGSSKIKFGAK